MKYTVDLENKKITFDDECPKGHIIALKAIYERQGYRFLSYQEDMDEMLVQAKAGLESQPMTPSQCFTSHTITYVDAWGNPSPMNVEVEHNELYDGPLTEKEEFDITTDEIYEMYRSPGVPINGKKRN